MKVKIEILKNYMKSTTSCNHSYTTFEKDILNFFKHYSFFLSNKKKIQLYEKKSIRVVKKKEEASYFQDKFVTFFIVFYEPAQTYAYLN